MRSLAGKEEPDSPEPLTDRDRAYTLYRNHAAKRFTAPDGTSWVIIRKFDRNTFKTQEEARRFIDREAERIYRKHLRDRLSAAGQLCEQGVPTEQPKQRQHERVIEVRPKPAEAGAPGTHSPRTTMPVLGIDNPIVIDGFPFNDWSLPESGRGREQLDKLVQLPLEARHAIRITRIEGHTDRVPMRLHPKRFATLRELSDRRANQVRTMLARAGFVLTDHNELKAAEEAVVSRHASEAARARDRKVVVYWSPA